VLSVSAVGASGSGTRVRRLSVAGAVLGVGLALAVVAGALLLGREGERAPQGVYRGAIDPAAIAEYERWLGGEVDWALTFLPGSDWDSLASPTAWARAWSESPYRVVYSVPLVVESGGSLREGASGAYNDHFARLGRTLIEHGEEDAVLRLGWEFNGDWMTWTAKDDPAAFAEYWRHIVRTMRALPGSAFTFDWCPAAGPSAMRAELAYPGNEYVDYIGLDAYDVVSASGVTDADRRWQEVLERPYGLQWHREFAREHGKPMTYPEWGVWLRHDGLGGGDNPYFIEKMHEWIEDNDVAYHMYFDYDAPDGPHRLSAGQFPRSAAVFQERFGT
jgi:Glycosyl hydrolase family 26